MKLSGLSLVKDITEAVLLKLKKVPLKDVLVGIPNTKAERKAEEGEENKVTNAMLGYIHENGAPEVNIPPRPFLSPGIYDAREKIEESLKQAARSALEGRTESVDRYLNAAGLTAQTSVKKKITDGPFVDLKDATLAARKRRGFKGESPLIESGQLRNSITYVIRENKD